MHNKHPGVAIESEQDNEGSFQNEEEIDEFGRLDLSEKLDEESLEIPPSKRFKSSSTSRGGSSLALKKLKTSP